MFYRACTTEIQDRVSRRVTVAHHTRVPARPIADNSFWNRLRYYRVVWTTRALKGFLKSDKDNSSDCLIGRCHHRTTYSN